MNAPLKFAPQFRPMVWGGTRLRALLGHAPSDEPTGEAWILSDVEGTHSAIDGGEHHGRTLRDVLARHGASILGDACGGHAERFPLLLKLLDARQELSVQVHPTDELARQWHGPAHRGKTEAWLILDADPATSRIYSGVRPGTTAAHFTQALEAGALPEVMHSFTPQVGDCVFLPAGTVHAIGRDIVLFEVQQTCDLTYRLYDWGRRDPKTNSPRELHLERGLAASDLSTGPNNPVTPRPATSDGLEVLVESDHFRLSRATNPTSLGAPGTWSAVVGLSGTGTVGGRTLNVGEVVLIPASVGTVEASGTFTAAVCGV